MRTLFAALHRRLRDTIAAHVIRQDDIIRRLRREFALLGYDLTDEEITHAVERMTDAFAHAGVTADEAARALIHLYRLPTE